MIQPILSVRGNSWKKPAFKNSATASPVEIKQNDVVNSGASELKNYLEEKEKREQKASYILLGLVSAFTLGTIVVYPKLIERLSGKGNSNRNNFKRCFYSLKNDDSIPTLDTCKSINPKLKAFLEDQVLFSKAKKEDLIKTGNPTASNRLIMYGPPGSGKSFFSKIFAKTIDADYMEIDYGEVNRRFVGEHNENFKGIFSDIIQQAKKAPDKKFVVNFNEIDSIMSTMDSAVESGGGHVSSKIEERAIFLTNLEDLANITPNVIFIGSTNASAKGKLDRAAVSRIKNVIEVNYPDKNSLFEALKENIRMIPDGEAFVQANESEIEHFAEEMYNRNASFRDLNNVINESKNRYLKETIKDQNSTYKMDYLRKSFESLELTDGETNGIKK